MLSSSTNAAPEARVLAVTIDAILPRVSENPHVDRVDQGLIADLGGWCQCSSLPVPMGWEQRLVDYASQFDAMVLIDMYNDQRRRMITDAVMSHVEECETAWINYEVRERRHTHTAWAVGLAVERISEKMARSFSEIVLLTEGDAWARDETLQALRRRFPGMALSALSTHPFFGFLGQGPIIPVDLTLTVDEINTAGKVAESNAILDQVFTRPGHVWGVERYRTASRVKELPSFDEKGSATFHFHRRIMCDHEAQQAREVMPFCDALLAPIFTATVIPALTNLGGTQGPELAAEFASLKESTLIVRDAFAQAWEELSTGKWHWTRNILEIEHLASVRKKLHATQVNLEKGLATIPRVHVAHCQVTTANEHLLRLLEALSRYEHADRDYVREHPEILALQPTTGNTESEQWFGSAAYASMWKSLTVYERWHLPLPTALSAMGKRPEDQTALIFTEGWGNSAFNPAQFLGFLVPDEDGESVWNNGCNQGVRRIVEDDNPRIPFVSAPMWIAIGRLYGCLLADDHPDTPQFVIKKSDNEWNLTSHVTLAHPQDVYRLSRLVQVAAHAVLDLDWEDPQYDGPERCLTAYDATLRQRLADLTSADAVTEYATGKPLIGEHHSEYYCLLTSEEEFRMTA
jgi:hypothetical protein